MRTTGSAAMEFLGQNWLNWAGPPVEMVMDSATEFNSEDFQQFLQKFNIRSITTNPESHWQNGKAERHGSFYTTDVD